MLVEPLVFVSKQQPEETRIDIFDRRREPPATLTGCICPQQPALTIKHDVRVLEVCPEWGRPQRIYPACAGNNNRGDDAACPGDNPLPAFHLTAISTDPVDVRPNRSGRYMSSTFAWGSTYRPGDTARTTYATVNTGGESLLRSKAAVKRSSRNSLFTGSAASAIQLSVPVSPDETSRGLSISKPAGR